MVAVNSSAISDVEYSEATWTMEITFKSGAKYCYHDIPREVYKELIKAESIGRHYAKQIKGRFPAFPL